MHGLVAIKNDSPSSKQTGNMLQTGVSVMRSSETEGRKTKFHGKKYAAPACCLEKCFSRNKYVHINTE